MEGNGLHPDPGTSVAACGRVQSQLHERTLVGIAPAEVKKLATGNGNAKKPAVMEAAVARWGEQANDPDIADAAWVAEHCRRFMHEKFSEGA